jgi:hypothetical protein
MSAYRITRERAGVGTLCAAAQSHPALVPPRGWLRRRYG